MQFNDTTNKTGLIQECEFWTNLGDGAISGDSNLLKLFTTRINRGYDNVLPILLSSDDTLVWDDPNHTKQPVGTTNLVSGQQDYGVLTDEQGNSILNVVKAFVLQNPASTTYVPLRRIAVGTGFEDRILNPIPGYVGIPTEYVERGSSLFLGAVPNYDATDGLKIMFERSPIYYVSTDTNKLPGIPEPFHMLLALYASLDYVLVHKAEDATLVSRLEARIAKTEKALKAQSSTRNPKRKRVMGTRTNAV